VSEYIVTARKWRPMRFEDVAGQNHVTITLRNALSSKRLAHAYLFSGPRGVGKTTTARLLAKALNCAAPVDSNPDNTCESCKEITEGRSFDVLEIDGASNRGVEEIRNLRESVRYAPAKGGYKVYIIDEVHMLTKEAFNALLKTLEEPPPHVVFIFATTEVHKLPATILSRCQRFDFRRIGVEQIMTNLRGIAHEEKLKIDDEALLLIARKGDGSLRDAQSFFDQVVALCGRDITHAQILEALNIVDVEVYFRVTGLIRARDARGALALVEELMANGHDLREFLSGLQEHFRNLLVVQTTGAPTLIETSDVYRQRYAEEAAQFTTADLLRYQRFVGTTEAALRYSAQPRFKLEADMVQLVLLPGAADVGNILERLDELKQHAGEVAVDTPVHTATRTMPPRPPMRPATTPAAAPPSSQEPAQKISGDEVRSRWEEYLGVVKKQKISLAAVLEAVQLLGVEGGTVRLACENEFQSSSIMRAREFLQNVFQQLFHATPRITVEVRSGISPTGAQGTEPKPSAPGDDIIEVMKRELGAEPM
jgi:DNA polymerase III subunit gamma/tau